MLGLVQQRSAASLASPAVADEPLQNVQRRQTTPLPRKQPWRAGWALSEVVPLTGIERLWAE